VSALPAPMLCKTSLRPHLDEHAKWEGYVAEPKHDGARCLAIVSEDGVKLYSRSGGDFTDHVPHLTEALKHLPTGTMLDGELAIVTHDVSVHGNTVPVTNFNSTMRILGSLSERGRMLQESLGTLTYILYDIPQWGTEDYTGKTWTERRAELEKIIDSESSNLVLNPYWDSPALYGSVFDTLIEYGVEGIIAKNTASGYDFDGRPNKTWYKVKAEITMDMVVSGFTDGAGKYEGLIGAIEFSRTDVDTGELIYVGRCSGMTDAVRREVSQDRDAFLGRVIEVKSNELVGSKEYRTPRHPQFVTFRIDKNPEDCTGEELRCLVKARSES